MNLKRTFYLILGFIGLIFGFIGAMVPLLPAFPFLLIAALSFGKSSERLHTWFINTKVYKNNLESYLQKKGMTQRAKINLIIAVTISMSIGFFMMRRLVIGQIILAIVWVGHLFYFWFGVPTINEKGEIDNELQPVKKAP
ncbi:MAG TPA: DUF454 domain-containing protein [Erysipelothrix sp.]|nr:DUF454 domain-containing protein [Erysipelothrix sp.]